ncbi:unnamed protein product [Boreogadus saida]
MVLHSERTGQAVREGQTGCQRGPDRRSERTRQAVREDQTGGLRGPDRRDIRVLCNVSSSTVSETSQSSVIVRDVTVLCNVSSFTVSETPNSSVQSTDPTADGRSLRVSGLRPLAYMYFLVQ